MLEEVKRKEVDKRDKQLPQSFEQLIQMYDLEKLWTYIGNIIEYINGNIKAQSGKLKIGVILIQWGILSNVEVPATSYTQYVVTFPEAYTSAPEVFVQSKGNYNIIAQVSSSNTISTYINVRSNDGSARTGRNFSWLAIGLKE